MGSIGSVGRHGRPWEDMGNATGSPTINLVQNGFFLLSSHVHQKLDQYFISVNPDGGYKIVVFDIDVFGFDGRILDFACQYPPRA